MHTVLLVFDIGSSGLKASLMDEDLNILRNVTTTYPTRRRAGGVVEQDAADWWMSAVRAMLMLRELVPEYVKRVDAVGHLAATCGAACRWIATDSRSSAP